MMNTKTEHQETVVIFGCWRQSLSVIRSLGRAGYGVELIRQTGSAYLERSRYLDKALHFPDHRQNSTLFLQQLSDYLDSIAGPVFLYPVGDSEIEYILKHRQHLPETVTLVVPPSEVIEICASKKVMYQYAEQAGVPCMQSVLVNDDSELFHAAEKIGFPILVKADNEATRIQGKKAIICHDAQQMKSWFSGWKKEEHPLIVQTYFMGPRYNVYFFAVNGQMRIDAQIKILRTDMYDDTGLAVDGVAIEPSAELTEYTRKLVAKLGYHGAGCAQYLVNEKDAMFLEINSRLGANFAAVYRSGLDLPRLSVELFASRPVEQLLEGSRIKHNNRYAWFYGDILGFSRAVFRRQIRWADARRWLVRLIQTQAKANLHITWDASDPMPSFWIWFDRLVPWRAKPSL